MASYNRHLSLDSNFLLEYMEKMSETDSDLDFDGYVDNPELNSEEEECTTSSFQSYHSHPSGLATSCPPSIRPAPPPPSMSASLRVSSPIMRQLNELLHPKYHCYDRLSLSHLESVRI